MGRSQETSNKKEKEKKKLKKKQEKELKRKERKANSEKGKSFEDMLAYVDENGHLTDTPPDPAKKKKIKAEDIQLGATKREDIEPEDLVRKGTVTFFNDSKGYGFIKDHANQESIFVHINGLEDEVREGDKVSFETEMGQKGLNAVNVKLYKEEKPKEVKEVDQEKEGKADQQDEDDKE
jgi:cold shock CspA family protein